MDEYIREDLKKLMLEAEKIKRAFDDCQTFKENKNILKDAQTAVDFYEGRQWEKNKKKLPFQKPVINVIQNMVDGKVASVLNKSWKVNYIVTDDMALTDKVNKFTEWQMSEIDQDALNYRNALEAILKGTFFNYWYWDEEREGEIGVNEGGVEASNVDIQDIAFANPKQRNIQKQDYIILRSRESVKRVKELVDEGLLTDKEKNELIISDNHKSYYTKDYEQNEEDYLDVFTKFFRVDGEVWFEKSTANVLFQKPRAINPKISEKMIRENKKAKEEEEKKNLVGEQDEENKSIYENDYNDNLMKVAKPEELEETTFDEEEGNATERFKATQYPFTMGSFIDRDGCIFGISWVSQLVAPQKNINQLMATTLLTATKWTMPHLVVKEGALGTQQIDMSKPGGIITDYSPSGTDGIKLLNYGTMPTAHYELAQSMITMLKDVYRTNDILNDGRNTSKGMSGYAMSLISSIQEMPIAQWQEKMKRAIKSEGRILEMYYKLYYRNKKFSYKRTDAEIIAAQSEQPNARIPTMVSDTFDGAEYLETPFNVNVEVGESAKYNEQSFVNLIETLFLNGTIEKLSPENLDMYITMMPDSLFPKKSEFKLLIKQKEQGIITQLQQVNEQYAQTIEQLQGQLQELGTRQQIKEEQFKQAINSYNANLKRLGQQNEYNRYVANNGTNNSAE